MNRLGDTARKPTGSLAVGDVAPRLAFFSGVPLESDDSPTLGISVAERRERRRSIHRTRRVRRLCRLPRGVSGLLGILLLLVGGCSPGPTAPILVLERETVVLGEVVADSRQKITVKLNNHGSGPLQLRELGTSCTCSGASVSSDTIEAGAVGELWIGITPKSAGAGSAIVTIQSNCSIKPRQAVRVEWTCVAPLEVVPPIIDLGNVRPGQVLTRDVTILCRKHLLPVGKTCRLLSVTSTDPRCVFTGQVPQELTSDAPTTVGTLTMTVGDLLGDARTRLLLNIEGAIEKELELQAAWKVVDLVETVPQRLSLGESIAGSKEIQSGILLIRSNAAALEWGRITSSADWFEATPELIPPTLAHLTVQRVGELQVGIHTGEVSVELKSPVMRTVTIPISLTIAKAKEVAP